MTDLADSLPSFSLESHSGQSYAFPASKPSVVCFVKEDCPTCIEVMPILEALYQHISADVDVYVVGQTKAGNQILADRFKPSYPLLDDSSLSVSFASNIDTVPAFIVCDSEGRIASRLSGFFRDEWKKTISGLCSSCELSELQFAWSELPEWRPGCGSLSVDPIVADRLYAESTKSPLRARRIEIAPMDDEFDFMADQSFGDGLPLVPPTPERVIRMLSSVSRDPQEVIAVMPPNMGQVTVEKVAVNAVMAGCKPEFMPVIIAGVEAVCSDEFNIHGVMATTMGAFPLMVVNGPIRHTLGMNMKLGALGQGSRPNATIGRALRLVIRNLGGARPGGTERSTFGSPAKFTMCFAEWEERNPWSPLHVERGFDAEESVITIFAMTSGPTLIVDQDSRLASQLAGSLALCLESAFHPKAHFATEAMLVISPEHVDTLVSDGYTKDDIRRRIQEVTSRSIKQLQVDDVSGVGFKNEYYENLTEKQRNRLLPKFRSEKDIHITVAGSEAGKFSAAFHGWAAGAIGSIPVSRKIEEK